MSRYQALQDRLAAIEAQLPVRPAHQAPPRPAVVRRHDTADRVSPVLQQLLAEVLPGALVLDWRQDGATHAGRMAADGLLYRFRVDATGISYRPAWDAVGERGWQLRSDSFLQLRAPEARAKQQGRRRHQARHDEQRVTPRSAVGRGHLQRLQRLAGRHDTGSPMNTTIVDRELMNPAVQPDLRVAANLQRVEALLHHPTLACFLRTGRLPKHAITSPSTEPGTLRAMAPQEIAVDPVRFQFKAGASTATGVVKPVRPTADWDPLRAGVLSVWKDPRNGMVFVVNGHHRLEMAKQSNAAQVIVRFLNTTDSLEARAIGALQNIASGSSSAADRESFFRSNPGVTPVGLQLLGLEFAAPQPPRSDAEHLTLEQRFDALRKKCTTGYGCGSACISLRKECRSAPGSAMGKERMKRLLALAAGGASAQRGIAPVRGKEAGDLAAGISQRRGQQAAQLRGARARQKPSDQQNYAKFIQSADVPSRGEDWGTKARGQGKRLGGGMIQGAMSAAPTGIKQYPDFKRAKGMTPDIWEEARLMTDEGKKAVIGALQAGWSSDRALKLAYMMEPGSPSLRSEPALTPREQRLLNLAMEAMAATNRPRSPRRS